LNQFKEHIDLKADIKAWKKLTRTEKTWKKFKSLFTKAINENKIDTGTLKAIEMIAKAVKERVNQNKENQRILAQATVEANDKIEQLEKQQAGTTICSLDGKTTSTTTATTGYYRSHNQSIN
jgi:flagellar biosynthesis/type III secretory pathway chaperone